MRRTKIVCTIGPATADERMLARLLRAGMDVARLNFSHGTHESHHAVIRRLRALADRTGRPLSILQDLCGPKIRLGQLDKEPLPVRRGTVLTLTSSPDRRQGEISLPSPKLLEAVSVDDRLFCDDGRLEMRVLAKEPERITVRCLTEGTLLSRKGIAARGVTIDIPAVTEKDLADLRFGLSAGVDWVAASYVRTVEDLVPIGKLMEEVGIRRPIVAKIETSQAVRNLRDILEAADALMVARGDLGVDLPVEQVPRWQKVIIETCNAASKPVITATQMLDSMISRPVPTRAEATDVVNAILDGTDAVMLSGETATGDYPVECVNTMRRLALVAEQMVRENSVGRVLPAGASTPAHAVAQAVVEIARKVKARAVLCATTSGRTAQLIASLRPSVPVLGATHELATYRRLTLSWGVLPALVETAETTDEMVARAVEAAQQMGVARRGDLVILTAGAPVNTIGNTNLLRVHRVGEDVLGHEIPAGSSGWSA